MKAKLAIKTQAKSAKAKKAKAKSVRVTLEKPVRPTAEKLAAAAITGTGPLPYRTELEARFGRDLSGVQAVKGPEVEAALAKEGVEAAEMEGRVFLKADAPIGVVAHEVAHALQESASGSKPIEREAAQAENAVARQAPVSPIEAHKPAGDIAYRAPLEEEETVLEVVASPEQEQAFVQQAESTEAETPQPDADQTEGEGQNVDGSPANEAAVVEEEAPEPPTPTFAIAEAPDLDAALAQADAAAEEAEAALATAEDADDLVTAFAAAPPSVKAAREASLGQQAQDLSTQEQAQFDADMPEFEAQMTGTDDLEAVPPVATPEGDASALEEGAVSPSPEPQVDPTPQPEPANLNEAVSQLLSFFTPGNSGSLGRSFSRIDTRDSDVETSAGTRPEVPQEGETDPARAADLSNSARDDASTQGADAQNAVLEGPGPEQVGLREMREVFEVEAGEIPTLETAGGEADGIAAFNARTLDPEVTALFDGHHSQAMQESMAEAEAETTAAAQARDTDRDAELAKAEAERDRVNAEADQSQRDEALRRRQDIQAARQTAVDDQAREVDAVRTQADTEQVAAAEKIDTEITTTEAGVEEEFAGAEQDAETKVTEGERKADAERDKREREAENDSWWDRATDWVADQLSALTDFINDVFDAVRAAVKELIDAAKNAALKLIDAAANAIKDAISKLGEALKSAVNALLAEHFPEIARVLNEAIDGAVELAKAAVDVVAEGLKAAVTLVLDALAAGLDAILAAYQAAITGALALVRMAVTADWAALAKMILEPVLLALGIQPGAFYELIGRAVDALDAIIDDPLGFLANLVEAVTGGIRLFAENLFQHLQRGVIAWLAGPLGSSIKLPETWDLWGVLDLARQILGLTLDMIRSIAVRILGEEAVARIEFFMGYVTELITGGFTALWEKLTQDLANLQNTVLEQIKSFLVERVIMAAISWLAGLFSPVGALVKLVMTVWNFLMFLKDQFMRMYALVQKIINTMYDIAMGVLQPAQQGVEEAIGRFLPIALDLLARLLGLGNVPARVQQIIRDVRQAIEDAITKLIRKVLARFTGKDGGAKAEGDDKDNTTDLMPHIPFAGGGERHTLFIEERGADTVPMMRSTPQPVANWLAGLRGEELNAIGAKQDPPWSKEDTAKVREEIEPLIKKAIGEEAQLDAVADAANKVEDQNPAAKPPPTLKVEGEELAAVLGQILEKMGISGPELEKQFEKDIAALPDALKSRLKQHVLPRLDARLYGTLSWSKAVPMISAEAGIPDSWKRPGASGGIIRQVADKDWRAKIKEIVTADYPDAGLTDAADDKKTTDFINNYLSGQINTAAAREAMLTALLLSNSGGTGAAEAVRAYIKSAAERAFGKALGFDHAFHEVTGTFYRDKILADPAKVLASSKTYFDEEADNSAGAGASGRKEKFDFFVRPEAQGGSKRYTANRGRLADAVRAARPGQHEWLPASKAAGLLAEAADNIRDSGNTGSAAEVAKFLRFQDKVRTPTSKLIFKPGADLTGNKSRTIDYVSPAHIKSGKGPDLTEAQEAEYYPQTGPDKGPKYKTPMRVVNAHAGGLFAREPGGAKVQLQWSSPDWHKKLEKRLSEPVDDKSADTGDAARMKTAILGFYRETIWQGAAKLPAASGRHFDLYYTSSDSTDRSYGLLKDYAADIYDKTYKDLASAIEEAFK